MPLHIVHLVFYQPCPGFTSIERTAVNLKFSIWVTVSASDNFEFRASDNNSTFPLASATYLGSVVSAFLPLNAAKC